MGSATVVSTGGLEGAGALRAKGLNLQKREEQYINKDVPRYLRLHHITSMWSLKKRINTASQWCLTEN